MIGLMEKEYKNFWMAALTRDSGKMKDTMKERRNMPMDHFIQESGRTGTKMAKDSKNRKMGTPILEDSKMERDTGEASYTIRTESIWLFMKMEIC